MVARRNPRLRTWRWPTVLLIIVMAVCLGLFFEFVTNSGRHVQSVSINSALLDRESAIALALRGFEMKSNPKVVDVRLIRHEQSLREFIGIEVPYDDHQGWWPYKPDSPVWAVTLTADDLSYLPMFKEAPIDYKGATILLNAIDGTLVGIFGHAALDTSSEYQTLLKMENLEGKIKIIPLTETPVPYKPPGDVPVPDPPEDS